MNISLESSFTAFILTEEEETAGYEFHAANRAVIQNHISAAAEEILNLELTVPGSESVKVKEIEIAYLRGKIASLRHLLDQSDILKDMIEQKKKLQNQNQ